MARKAVAVSAIATLTGGLALGVLLTAAPAGAAVPGPAPVKQRTADDVTADVLPSVQINGVVWSQVTLGNTVYAGGSYTSARPAGAAAGTSEVARNNLLAYDITTGALITSFAPSLNAQVKKVILSPDKTRLYAVGNFTQANGQTRNRIAAYSTSTGQLISTFAPNVNGTVSAVTATNTTVYFGGTFNAVNGVARTRLAAVSASNGALTAWAPATEQPVNAMVLTPDNSKVVIGGSFQYLNGSPVYGLGAVDSASGASVPWVANQTVQAWTTPDNLAGGMGYGAAFLSLSADNDTVYATAYNYAGGGDIEGTVWMNPADGSIKTLEDCHGDTYDAFPMNGTIYTVSHAHYCATLNGWPVYDPWQRRYAVAFTKNATGTLAHNGQGGYQDYYGQPAPSLVNWFPDLTPGTYTTSKQAGWSVTGNGKYLAVGGEFTAVSGTKQQGIVRFAVPSIAPKKERPRNSGPNFPVALRSVTAGAVRVSWTANWDRDDTTLTYKVFRDGNNDTPVYTTTADSQWWNTPKMGFTDTGLAPGSTHTYYVSAYDADGNVAKGSSDSVTVTSTGTLTAYDSKVLLDGASSYWPYGESSGTTAYDYAGLDDMTTNGGVTRGVSGPIPGATATGFDGSSGSASTSTLTQGPDTFSVSAWVRTTSNRGGKIVGFGNAQTGNSSSYDRQVYIDANGRVVFGVYPNAVATVQSAKAVNDGAWHQIVASLGANGMTLFVDGKQVANRADVTSGQGFTGYWRVGGDNLSGWPNQPASFNLNGVIGNVAIFPKAVDLATVRGEYAAAGNTVNVPPSPTDAYGKAVYADNPDSYWRLDDASGPTAADASVNGAPGVYSGGETFRAASTVTGANGTGVAFNGSDGTIASQDAIDNPSTYSEEAWFNTTTNRGGKLLGFGDRQSGGSSNYDRHVYMLDNGQLVFGTWTGTANIAQSTNSYNDGKWHHVVATQGSNGMVLYVDGQVVGTNGQTGAQAYSGYWRVGGDTSWGGSSSFFNGTIDEAAFYHTALSASQVSAHYYASVGAPNQAPTAAFTSSTANLTASFDGTGSTDSDGTIASYSWDFGDGTAAGSGAQPTHAYTQAGTYTVTLTVTDDKGAAGTATGSVTVTKANVKPTAAFTSSTANLTASFDGTGSTDSDGTIASYSWDFGDGTAAGSGAQPTHAYTQAGTYTVTLTVTDDKGAAGTATGSVTVTKANVKPTAAFTSSTANLTASFDGTGSTDSDGTIASYSWNFGDGTAAGSGAQPTHAYTQAGTYTVTLTVTDDKGATGTVTGSVTVSKANQAPTAAFTSSASGLNASFDGSGSTDSDGTIASYSWNFGDGTAAGSGAQPTHPYTQAGTYTVTLTVTDDKGATNSASSPVTVAVVATSAVATDTYTRTGTGWGTADTGGLWTTAGTASAFSTNGSKASAKLTTAGQTLSGYLNSVSEQQVNESIDTSVDVVPNAASVNVALAAHRIGKSDYRLKERFMAGGTVQLAISRVVNGTETTIREVKVAGLTYAAGDVLRMRFVVTGTGTTATLAGKVWKVGTTEPTSAQLTVTDTEPTLQAAGGIGVVVVLSSTTTPPVTVTLDNLSAVKP